MFFVAHVQTFARFLHVLKHSFIVSNFYTFVHMFLLLPFFTLFFPHFFFAHVLHRFRTFSTLFFTLYLRFFKILFYTFFCENLRNIVKKL